MNQEKVAFGFFVILALSLNFGFVMGDIDNPAHHNVYELFAAIVVSLIATVLKFGDRTQVGAVIANVISVVLLIIETVMLRR